MILCYASLIAGEEERELKTDSFAMNVKADTAANLEGQTLAGGTVQVPAGALAGASGDAESSGMVSSSVVAWDGPGHLYWAVGNSDNNENSTRGSTTLASSLLSVSFSRNGVEVSVKGLTQEPFVITLTMSEDEKYGRRRLAGRIGCRNPECASWDVAQGKFIADGVLLYRSDDGLSINCSYTHLTAFGGMAGNTAVYIHFVATKLRNAYKFNAVFLPLRRANQ